MMRRPPRSTLFPSRRSPDLNDHPLLQLNDASPDRLDHDIECNGQSSKVDSLGSERLGPHYRWWTSRSDPSESNFEDCPVRSEEHTSELQSPDQLLCRLLLGK